MTIFELSKQFPAEEKYSLTDQIRRSSRSVCANFAEAWRKRRYKGDIKSDGWQWHKTRLREPARAERIWLAMAVATLTDCNNW